MTPAIARLVEFVETSKLGVCGPYRGGLDTGGGPGDRETDLDGTTEGIGSGLPVADEERIF